MNYAKRILGTVLSLLPLALLLVSLLVGITRPQQPNPVAVVVMTAAALIAVINFYLSYIRPVFFVLRRGSMEGYRFASGIPMIGSLLVSIAAVVGFGSISVALIGIGAFAVDTAGSGWFLVATWGDSSLWDS